MEGFMDTKDITKKAIATIEKSVLEKCGGDQSKADAIIKEVKKNLDTNSIWQTVFNSPDPDK